MALNYLICLLDIIGRLATRNADNLLLRGMYGRRPAQASVWRACSCRPLMARSLACPCRYITSLEPLPCKCRWQSTLSFPFSLPLRREQTTMLHCEDKLVRVQVPVDESNPHPKPYRNAQARPPQAMLALTEITQWRMSELVARSVAEYTSIFGAAALLTFGSITPQTGQPVHAASVWTVAGVQARADLKDYGL